MLNTKIPAQIILCLLSLFTITEISAQQSTRPRKPKKEHILTPDEAKVIKKDAAEFFAIGDYEGALKAYIPLQKADPKNADFNYRLGYCYLVTNVDKTKALPFLQYASEQKGVKNEVFYYLGQAYQFQEKWDEAIQSFEQYKSISKSKVIKDLLEVDRQIEICTNAKNLTQNPVNVTFVNPGRTINTMFPDYYPQVAADRSILVFTSRRKGNAGGFIEDLGFFTADVYWSMWKDTAWSKAKSIGASVNGPLDEESIGLTPSGTEMFLFFDNEVAYGDVMHSKLKGKTWQRPEQVGGGVFSKAFETGATVTPDGMTMYFASDRKEKGSYGGSDIYMVKRNEKGEWGLAENLGSVINTKYDDDTPFIFTDGKTLYFASKGHGSMGGYDIFKSVWNEETGSWSQPENIGYPINTADDNLYFSLTGNGKYGYVTAVRSEGMGDQDVYEVLFNEASGYILYRAKMLNQPGSKVEYGSISLMSKEDGKKIIDTKLEYIGGALMISLKPGKYVLNVDANGFSSYSKEIEVLENATENILDDIRLTPLGKKTK
jgi:hypothetical protein